MSVFRSSWIQDIGRALLSGGISRTVRSVQIFLEEAMHHVLEEASQSLRRLISLYAALAALALVTVFALGAAFSEGLVALGLPAWCSHLILAAVTGLIAGVIYSRAGTSPAKPQDDQDEGPRSGGRGFTLKIVHVHPPATAQAKQTRSKGRPAARRRVVEVRPAGDGWEVMSSRSPSKRKVFATRRGALRAATVAARKESAEVVISGNPDTPPFQGVA